MMGRRGFLALGAAAATLGLALFASRSRSVAVPPPLPAPEGALKVYHLGHSLVGQEVPHMLAQLAPQGHAYNSQLGSGTSLRGHWEPDEPILHFNRSNHPPAYRDAREAVGSGDYDAVVLTEMVELRDALKYFDAAKYLGKWADLARGANPAPRLYLYETWHQLDDPDGWLERIDADLDRLWIQKLLGPDSRRNPDQPVYLIPGGQVLAAVVRAAEAGEIPGITHRENLFHYYANGKLDKIHVNEHGKYIMALTHYAVLYQRSPVGLPYQLEGQDANFIRALSEPAARRIQEIVWQVVRSHPRTGITGAGDAA